MVRSIGPVETVAELVVGPVTAVDLNDMQCKRCPAGKEPNSDRSLCVDCAAGTA